MPRSTSKAEKIEPSTQANRVNAQAYYNFVASVQPVRIELTELSAKTAHSDAAEMKLQAESRFVVTCPKQDDAGFTAEARLELRFLAETGAAIGHIQCTYRLDYQADMLLSEGLLDQFARVNVPGNVWPFMRELVMNLTLRFGWSGSVLPSFLIPPIEETISREELTVPATVPIKKVRKTAQNSKTT